MLLEVKCIVLQSSAMRVGLSRSYIDVGYLSDFSQKYCIISDFTSNLPDKRSDKKPSILPFK